MRLEITPETGLTYRKHLHSTAAGLTGTEKAQIENLSESTRRNPGMEEADTWRLLPNSIFTLLHLLVRKQIFTWNAITELFSYHLDVQRIDKDENKCVPTIVKKKVYSSLIFLQVEPQKRKWWEQMSLQARYDLFQSHITLSFSLFGLTGQSNLLLWVRKPETVLLLLFLVPPLLVTSSFRPTHFQHD